MATITFTTPPLTTTTTTLASSLGLGSALPPFFGLTSTTVTPELKTSVTALNTAYSDALHIANSVAPYLYYSDVYNTPSIKKKFYNDLNDDSQVQKTVTKYFYYKVIDKWLYDDLLPLLAYIEIDNGEPRLIKSLDDYNIEKLGKESESDTRKKVKYMENKVISKDLVKHVLKKICSENNINWYSLNKYSGKVKKILFKYLSDKIKNVINKH
jgi:hypothetical protein